MACKYGFCGQSDIAEMAESFTGFRIGKMNLEHRNGDRLDRVVDRDRCVGEAGGIQQNGLCPGGLRFVQPVDQMTFMIGLAKVDVRPGIARLVIQPSGDVVQRIAPVNVRFARSEQVEIGAVQYKDEWPLKQISFPVSGRAGCRPRMKVTI